MQVVGCHIVLLQGAVLTPHWVYTEHAVLGDMYAPCCRKTFHLQELWLELQGEQDMQAALSSLPAGKMLLVDYYASESAGQLRFLLQAAV